LRVTVTARQRPRCARSTGTRRARDRAGPAPLREALRYVIADAPSAGAERGGCVGRFDGWLGSGRSSMPQPGSWPARSLRVNGVIRGCVTRAVSERGCSRRPCLRRTVFYTRT